MPNFQLPADSPEAHLLDHLMPDEEFSCDIDGKIVTLRCVQAEPTDMTPAGDMLWKKSFACDAVEPQDQIVHAIIPREDDHVTFDKERGIMRVTRTYPDGSKRIAIFPAASWD